MEEPIPEACHRGRLAHITKLSRRIPEVLDNIPALLQEPSESILQFV